MNIKQDKSYQEKEAMLEFYSEVIAEHLVPSHIIPSLAHVLDNLKVEEIITAEKRGDRKLASALTINYLKNSMYPSWLTEFITALENGSFKILVGLIEGRIDIIHHKMYRNLLNIFYSNVAKDLDASEVLPYLIECECLTICDFEDILAVEKSSGRGMACLTLLTRIGTKNEYWFPHFMFALKSTVYSHLVEAIEPLFISTNSLAEAESVGDKIIQENKRDGLNTKPNIYVDQPGSDNKENTAIQDVVQNFNELDLDLQTDQANDLDLQTDQAYDELDNCTTHSLGEETSSLNNKDLYSLPTGFNGCSNTTLFSSKSESQLGYLVCRGHSKTQASDMWCLKCGTKFYDVFYEDKQNSTRLRRCISCVTRVSVVENTVYEDPDNRQTPETVHPESKADIQDKYQCSLERHEQSSQQNTYQMCSTQYQNIKSRLDHPKYMNCERTKLCTNKISEEEMNLRPVPPPRKKHQKRTASEKATSAKKDYKVPHRSNIDNQPIDFSPVFHLYPEEERSAFGMNFELNTPCEENVQEIMDYYKI